MIMGKPSKEGYMLNINGTVGYFPKEFIEEAISKRIKVKPISDHKHIHTFYYCPDCKCHIGDEPEVNNPCLRPNHCQHCGQAFDWGDIE